MALHPAFPLSPYNILEPAHRWFPADEALRASAYERLLPPLVAQVRAEVTAARQSENGPTYSFVSVDQKGFERHSPATLAELAPMFHEYQLEAR